MRQGTFEAEYKAMPTDKLLQIKPCLEGQTRMNGRENHPKSITVQRLTAINAELARRGHSAKPPALSVVKAGDAEKVAEQAHADAPDFRLAAKYINKAQNARQRGIDFSLSLSDMRRLLNKKRCHYTGRILDDEDETNPNFRSIDRVDASIGYVPGNCVACCAFVNEVKNQLLEMDTKAMMTVREFKRMATKL